MTYTFEHMPKKRLQELQLQSASKRRENYSFKYRKALALMNKYKDIHVVMSHFGVKRDNAYKMVKKGREIHE